MHRKLRHRHPGYPLLGGLVYSLGAGRTQSTTKQARQPVYDAAAASLQRRRHAAVILELHLCDFVAQQIINKSTTNPQQISQMELEHTAHRGKIWDDVVNKTTTA